MKNLLFLLLSVPLLLSADSLMPESLARSNPNLYVSAENMLFENHFAGPMVIEVIVDDSGISGLTDSLQEPIVTVDGNRLRMAQSDDGKWYGYFAELTQAQEADSLVGLGGYGLDFGEMCSSDSAIAGLSLAETSGFAIPRDASSGSNGLEPLVACTGDVLPSDALLNNVVREYPALSTQSNSTGQVGIDADAWPLIQLFDLTPGSEIPVNYERSGGTQSVALTFASTDEFSAMALDGTFYRPGQDIRIEISDVMLNIDPTDEDSWTWASVSGSEKLYYRLFDVDGASEADGTSGAVNIHDGDNLANMMFGDSGIFSLNPNPQGAPDAVVLLQDNDYTILEDKYTSDSSVDRGTGSISHSEYPITFTETSSNSHSFVNYDRDGTSNTIINPEADAGKSASFEYNESVANVVVKLGSPPVALDYSGSVAKGSSILFTVINDSTDPDGDDLAVTISDVTGLDGFAVVNENGTITFTPDSGFADTTSFEYAIDDGNDGVDTGIITIDLESAALPASVSGIAVYSDKSEYEVGEPMSARWAVPDDSWGTDSLLKVITPFGTTAISNATAGADSVIATEDFDEGAHTIRIEHGQYYGEKSVLFSPADAEGDDVVASEQAGPDSIAGTAPPDSCESGPVISTSLASLSYSKGDQISVHMELCDVVSDESVIVQIFDPLNAQLSVDQFLPSAKSFDRQYLADGVLWKLEGEYTVRSTYMRTFAESSLDFAIPVKKGTPQDAAVPERDTASESPADTVASFVDPARDPQHYVDRYSNEEPYREWFDSNYPQYDSIYDAVGLDEAASKAGPETEAADFSGGKPESETIQNPTCGAGTELKGGMCHAIQHDAQAACGAGTELRGGMCHAVRHSTGNPEESSILEGLFGLFRNVFG